MPKIPVASCLLLLITFVCRAFGGEPQNEPAPHGKCNLSWPDRREALQMELKKHKLSSPEAQDKVIETLEQETADPNWTDLAEGQDYEDYHGNLLQLCQEIAETYESARAWHALVYSIYSLDSALGKWLTAQPQTFPLYLEMLHSGEDGRPGFAKEAFAAMLARCAVPNSSSCSPVLARREELMRRIRSELFLHQTAKGITAQGKSKSDSQQLTSNSVLSSIQALAVCGFPEDVLLLDKLADQYASRKFYQADSPAAEDQRAVMWLIHDAEQKIKNREVAH